MDEFENDEADAKLAFVLLESACPLTAISLRFTVKGFRKYGHRGEFAKGQQCVS